MKILDTVQIAALLIAGAMVLGGEPLDMPWMSQAALVAFGVAVVMGGLRIMITGEARGAAAGMDRWYRETEHTERHTGIPARLIGALLLVAGPLTIVMGAIALTTPGGIDAFWAGFLTSPRAWGSVAGLAGLMMVLAGVVRVVAGSGAAPGAHTRLIEAEFRIGGLVTTVAGLGLLILAAVLLISPDYLPNALDRLR